MFTFKITDNPEYTIYTVLRNGHDDKEFKIYNNCFDKLVKYLNDTSDNSPKSNNFTSSCDGFWYDVLNEHLVKIEQHGGFSQIYIVIYDITVDIMNYGRTTGKKIRDDRKYGQV